jgi:Polyketide cyclase / dehydrase and lipid transport
MGDLHLHVEISAPRDRVFVFFVPQRMPLWYLPEMDTEFEVSGGEPDFRAGQKVRISGRLGSREVSLVAVVQRYEWLRALEWEFKDAYGVRGRQTWEVEDSPGIGGPGKGPVPVGIAGPGEGPVQIPCVTRVTMHERYTFPGRLGRWLDPILMRPGIRARNKRMLAKLKSLAENRGSAS